METKKQQEKKIQYIICRVCGYIETADKADQPCPACGFPKTVWMEYNPRRLNPTRKKLLDLHLHPIAVHFPITGSAGTLLLPLIALVVPYGLSYRLFDMVTLIAMIMPLLTLIGAVSGYIGGKLRYKTTTAPLLKRKMYLSIVYFLITLGQSYIAFSTGVGPENALIMAGLGLVSSVVAAILGKQGSHLFAGLHGPYVAG
ncbi:rubredoxin-like domain-containing protein [Veillonella magna]|uniref:Rubredoxin-like domain-containing protein n=1 Tax=Veillonella magna TaxID=464322 RepID=A0ABS2GFX2_9FIRM|nr:hypothetical protein [Veillonella magna]MBD8976104.1 hypothetical protein [Veillonella magna]MBM6823894.1 hypothetical protein [Veillonella magna]MBM6912034.1 hypothetical protein [Veillonella magna]